MSYAQLSPEEHGFRLNVYMNGYRVTTRLFQPITQLRETRELALRGFRDHMGRLRERCLEPR